MKYSKWSTFVHTALVSRRCGKTHSLGSNMALTVSDETVSRRLRCETVDTGGPVSHRGGSVEAVSARRLLTVSEALARD